MAYAPRSLSEWKLKTEDRQQLNKYVDACAVGHVRLQMYRGYAVEPPKVVLILFPACVCCVRGGCILTCLFLYVMLGGGR